MREKLYQVVKSILILCWIVVLLGACAKVEESSESAVEIRDVTMYRVFISDEFYFPVWEFNTPGGLHCLRTHKGLWCERVEE